MKKKIHEIKKNYHESEVSSTWILANEAIGYISYICLFGGPIGICLGSIGVVGTSIVSYQQFKKDCTEYFEEYKGEDINVFNVGKGFTKQVQFFQALTLCLFCHSRHNGFLPILKNTEDKTPIGRKKVYKWIFIWF